MQPRPKVGVAVAVAVLRPFLADVEDRLGPQQPPGPLLGQPMAVERLGLVFLAELLLHEAEQVAAALLGLAARGRAGEVAAVGRRGRG